MLELHANKIKLAQAAHLERELEQLGFPYVELLDESYFLPELKWLLDYLNYAVDRPWEYDAQGSDCDDAALAAREECRRAWRKSKQYQQAGFAVGTARLVIAEGHTVCGIGGGSHMLNIARTPWKWVFFDRNTCVYEDAVAVIQGPACGQLVGVML